ncbi:hypothetical protein CYY_000577 [Polysphondylium violaceum]|uniref:Complex 1 LYR protein domain-containing protein n=1 Tax=Polysphondylium violaceum TaxID=133409 RepID=A0A8J4UX14_9MYCE|nr:hypothetical protein CYY_000577 [Polysphondylium violaceum]
MSLLNKYSGEKHKKKILTLFRSILRERLNLPTENRRQFILYKARTEFRNAKDETNPDRIKSLLIIGNTHLDTVMIQAQHLNLIMEREPTEFEKKSLMSWEDYKKQQLDMTPPEQHRTLTINSKFISKKNRQEKQDKSSKKAQDDDDDDIN